MPNLYDSILMAAIILLVIYAALAVSWLRKLHEATLLTHTHLRECKGQTFLIWQHLTDPSKRP